MTKKKSLLIPTKKKKWTKPKLTILDIKQTLIGQGSDFPPPNNPACDKPNPPPWCSS